MTSDHAVPLSKTDFEELARFRFGIRRYLRFSEETVRKRGLTSQQYQLMLALKGYPGKDWATIQELAGRLQLRHHSVVELVNRATDRALVRREPDPADARVARVVLTASGDEILEELSEMHRDELKLIASEFRLPALGT
ncbi:MarR family winged helix-turn-helix transcriptional regulator [Spelaeicoccus albus]|uniref:DNA-binding MarR family transcriptional regulator n=1 Tax=Spelaeicoccus albus TaxID=1280376 RepID=A0A7Z0D4E5_9MICO|nr:helix-turn-helix domain-containing protein [Spelaeicoccus albus]NYI68664.1 DNA-binding MarR family transcriptional regulator [Spelaeicoccus albus]